MVQELVAGRVDLLSRRRRSPSCRNIKAKQLKILATTSPERLERLPEVPTLKEQGFDFVRFGWLGVCAARRHAGADHQDAATSISCRSSRSPDYRALIENAGSIAVSSTPQELGAIMQKTSDDVVPSSQGIRHAAGPIDSE